MNPVAVLARQAERQPPCLFPGAESVTQGALRDPRLRYAPPFGVAASALDIRLAMSREQRIPSRADGFPRNREDFGTETYSPGRMFIWYCRHLLLPSTQSCLGVAALTPAGG